MKKYLLILTIFIASLFVINNVNAAEVVHVNIDYDSSFVTELVEKLNEEIEIAEELANHYKNTTRYSIVLRSDRVYFILYENATSTQIRPYFSGGGNNKIEGKPDNTSYKYIGIIDDTNYNLDLLISSLDSSSYRNTNYWNFFNSSLYIYGSSKPNSTFDLYEYSSVNYSSFMNWIGVIYDTNLDNIEIIETSNFLPISFNNGDILYSGDSFLTYKQVMVNTLSLKLKNMFNSGTNAYGMSKIIWNINAATDSKAIDGTINMKIQYGANDFTNKNIPIFNNYKIYGYNEFESGWTDITNDDRFYFDDFQYEYYTLEGVATETVMTSTLHIPSDMCVYEQIKVEFYFDNTNNFYMYVFDELDDSSWQDLAYYFENYSYYEFPTDKKYAFITHRENNRNIGKVYVAYNDIINTNSLFGAYIYDTQYKSVSRKLQEIKFEEHSYYYYYDFDFSFDNNEVLMLQRKTGTDEKVYFYIPSDFIVEFANDNQNVTILTPNGYIDVDSSKVDNIFSNDSKTFIDYLNTVRNYITNIGSYISSFFDVVTYFLHGLPGEVLTAIITVFIVLCATVIICLIRK